MRTFASEHAEPGALNEFHRPLTKEAIPQAKQVGHFMQGIVRKGDAVLGVPRRRTRTSALLALGHAYLSNRLILNRDLIYPDADLVLDVALRQAEENPSSSVFCLRTKMLYGA